MLNIQTNSLNGELIKRSSGFVSFCGFGFLFSSLRHPPPSSIHRNPGHGRPKKDDGRIRKKKKKDGVFFFQLQGYWWLSCFFFSCSSQSFLKIFFLEIFSPWFPVSFQFNSNWICLPPPSLSNTSHATLHLSAWNDLLLTYSNFLILKFEKIKRLRIKGGGGINDSRI